MKRRYTVYLVVIALLGAANLARLWIGSGENGADLSARGQAYFPEDFRLLAGNPAAAGSRRNLFQPGGQAERPVKSANRMPVKTQAQAPVSHNQVEAQAEMLDNVRLLGVVFRAGKAQAYIGLDKESVIAQAGDTVLGRFVVDKIEVEAVELRDIRDNTKRRVPVSGK